MFINKISHCIHKFGELCVKYNFIEVSLLNENIDNIINQQEEERLSTALKHINYSVFCFLKDIV